MIRRTTTGEVMVWRPTTDGHGGRRLTPIGDDGVESPIAYWYPSPMDSSLWISQHTRVGVQTSPQALEALLVDRGIIEIVDDPPAAAVRSTATAEATSTDFYAYVDALATMVAYDQSPPSIRVAAINELRRLATEER